MTTTSPLTNLREVGGRGLQQGRRRTVFRSNTEVVSPEAYPPSIEAVIDLRRDDEIELLAHPLSNTEAYRHVPLFDPAQPDESAEGALELEDQYVDWLDRHRATIVEVFRAIAATDGDVLVCCSAGKDRTGVVSALLARLWGADLDTIGADYAATAPALVDRFRAERGRSQDLGLTLRMQRCVPETAIHVVRHVEERFGSVAAYLRSVGLSPAEIARL